MKFQLSVTGTFNNVKALRVTSPYNLHATCGACNTRLPILAGWTSDPVRPNTSQTYRTAVVCRNCSSTVSFAAAAPANQIGSPSQALYSPVSGNACLVSVLVSVTGIITDISGLTLDVLTLQDTEIKNCTLDRLAGKDGSGNVAVQGARIVVETRM